MRQAVLNQILDSLTAEVEALFQAAKKSFAAATDPDSKAENKYDTRTLEASYIARGQAQRVAEAMEALNRFRALAAAEVESFEKAALGHLVSLQLPAETLHFFIGPAAGGLQVQVEDHLIDVITPASPLGQKLLGRKPGDTVQLSPAHSGQITQLS